MNKAELVDSIESRLGGKRAATEAVEAVLDAIIREVAKGNKVTLTGFGTFENVTRAPRTGRNPRTGETVPIEQTAVPRFRPGTSFRTVVADPRSLPRTGNAAARATAGSEAASARAAGGTKATARAGTAAARKPATGTKSAAKRSAAKTAATKTATSKTATSKTTKATTSETARKAAARTTRRSAASQAVPAKRSARKTTR